MDDITYYEEEVDRELKRLKEGKFTGNVEIKFNLKDGGICNINIKLTRSVKQ